MLRTDDVTVDGVRSPVLQGGPLAAKEAVVFVHGNPAFSEDWRDLSERLSGFARTIAPDMPGYGNADKPSTFDSMVMRSTLMGYLPNWVFAAFTSYCMTLAGHGV